MTPLVRTFLIIIAAVAAALLATVDDETVRVICTVIVTVTSGLGIIPPHIPTQIVIKDDE